MATDLLDRIADVATRTLLQRVWRRAQGLNGSERVMLEGRVVAYARGWLRQPFRDWGEIDKQERLTEDPDWQTYQALRRKFERGRAD